MKRSQLEHLIRAAGSIADDDLIIVGSRSILGQHPYPPKPLTASMKADVFPMHHPERADDIDGAIGEGSQFHETHGYYAQGVGPETAVAPEGWRERLVALRSEATAGRTGWCLEVHDLAIAKLVAGRPKDLEFVRVLAEHDMLSHARLSDLVSLTPVDTRVQDVLRKRVSMAFRRGA